MWAVEKIKTPTNRGVQNRKSEALQLDVCPTLLPSFWVLITIWRPRLIWYEYSGDQWAFAMLP